MQKYIFIHLLNDFSGSPKVLSQIIKTVQSNGRDLELYTCKSKGGFLSGIAVKHHKYYYKYSKYKFIVLLIFIYSQIILFCKLLKYFNKDVVIYINTMLPFGAALAGFLMRKQVVYHIHEISLKPKILKQFLRFIIKLTADKIIFVSNTVKLSEHIAGKKEYMVYNSIPKSFLDEAINQHLDIKKASFNVLMLASLKKYKGIDEFIEIASKLNSSKSICFTLAINASKKDIAKFLKKKVVTNNIKVLSGRSNVIPFYKRASLVLNLSHVDSCIETFGLTLIEAMSFGVPVIAPPIGGPTEIITNNVEGYLISSYEKDSITEKITNLSLDKNEWLRLSKNALIRSKYFNEKVFKEKILKILNE